MIELRKTDDLSLLMQWRKEVLACVFGSEPDDVLLTANREYYIRHIGDGSHIAYIASLNGEDAACGGVCLYDEMPSPDNPTGRCAYLMNIYVRSGFRHVGLAKSVVSQLVDDARNLGCGKIYLETTDLGRSLYASVGFSDLKNYMKYGSEKN